MSIMLSNGTVLPFGLLGVHDEEDAVAAFNRSYKNTGIKAGFIVASYDVSDPKNQSKLCTEYDVRTIEQFENQGTTAILYRNCLSSQSFGSIADYLEFTLRSQTYESKNAPSFSGQDGAIVLIQCLDNIGVKAIVVGYLAHPDRQTNITTTDPQLYGEYNGIQVQILTDGSTSLIFNGATDSDGEPLDSSQKPTTIQIQKDGTFTISDAFGNKVTTGSEGVNVTDLSGNIIATTSEGVKITDSNGGELNIENGKVALGNSTAELLDLFDQTLSAIQNLTVPTGVGPSSVPINSSQFAQIQNKLDAIKGDL